MNKSSEVTNFNQVWSSPTHEDETQEYLHTTHESPTLAAFSASHDQEKEEENITQFFVSDLKKNSGMKEQAERCVINMNLCYFYIIWGNKSQLLIHTKN